MRDRDSIRRLLDSGKAFALYRFPGESVPNLVLQMNGEVAVVPSCGKADARLSLMHGGVNTGEIEESGFVFAPFAETEKVPRLIIHADVAVRGWELIDEETRNLGKQRSTLSHIEMERRDNDIDHSDSYKVAFRSFKNQLDQEIFQKLVLSFSQLQEWNFSGHEDEFFLYAMERFPNSMVYLVYTPQSGRWVGCTPELLLEGYGLKWKTMALAGTRTAPSQTQWGTKEMHEQELVSEYIEGQLQTLNARIIRQGPYTAQAGNLQHLRTDFTFHTPIPMQASDILELLHPTPAVCGLPKREAWKFIRLFERNQRMYYGGYLGPLNLRAETRIFVNIRCAQIRPSGKALFFAGGGLTRDSLYWSEKEEVKRKLETLKNLAIKIV